MERESRRLGREKERDEWKPSLAIKKRERYIKKEEIDQEQLGYVGSLNEKKRRNEYFLFLFFLKEHTWLECSGFFFVYLRLVGWAGGSINHFSLRPGLVNDVHILYTHTRAQHTGYTCTLIYLAMKSGGVGKKESFWARQRNPARGKVAL
jgi:hypothetical protein